MPVTPYLHLTLNGSAEENRNWRLLDARVYSIAAQLMVDVILPESVTQVMLAKPSVGTPELINGAVTLAKCAPGLIPTALPPSGAATGDLAGTYPAPTIGLGKVMRDRLGSDVTPSLPPLPVAGDANKTVSVNPTGTGLLYTTAAPAVLTPGQVSTVYIADAPNGVTDGKITSVSWAKITGAPTTFPPSGSAGGDLSGSYPSPVIANNAVTASKIAPLAVGTAALADASVTTAKLATPSVQPVTLTPSATGGDIGKMVVVSSTTAFAYQAVPTALPPSGSAGGSLVGSYPSPTLSLTGVTAGTYGSTTKIPQVTLTAEGRVSTVTELTVAPAAGGPAGGDLSGTYPNPLVSKLNNQTLTSGDIYYVDATPAIARLPGNATGTVRFLRSVSGGVPSWQQVAYADISGTPTGLPPSGTAGGDLTGSYPNPTLTAAAKSKWAEASNIIQPANAAALIKCAAVANGLQWGTTTVLHTLRDSAGNCQIVTNATGTVTNDVTKSQWRLVMSAAGDAISFDRSPAGATPVWTALMVLDQTGKLLVSADPTSALHVATKQYVDAKAAAGTAGGDLGGTYPSPTVVKAQAGFFAPGTIDARVPSGTYINNKVTLQPAGGGAGEVPQLRLLRTDLASKEVILGHYNSEQLTVIATSGMRVIPAAGAALLTLDSLGELYLPTTGTVGGNTACKYGTLTVKGRLVVHPTADQNYLTVNAALNPAASAWVRDDTAKIAWMLQLSVLGDSLVLSRLSAAGVSSNPFVVDGTGNLTILGPTATKSAGTAWVASSDIRIKKNITPYLAGLTEILALKPIRFEHNGFADTVDGMECWGYLAEDVAKVMPECVIKHTKKLANETEIELDMLDTSNITLALVNAVKELATRLTALEGAP